MWFLICVSIINGHSFSYHYAGLTWPENERYACQNLAEDYNKIADKYQNSDMQFVCIKRK